MTHQDMTLMAHLLRRAGFGATREELEAYVAQGYEAVVEKLLHPGDPQAMPEDLIRRYHVDQSELRQLDAAGATWLGLFARTVTGSAAVGVGAALATGVFPFVIPDLIKLAAAAGLVPSLWRLVGRTG